jgi:putative transposase
LNLPRAERLALLEREGSELPLKTQAELLSLNRSSLYYPPVRPSPEEVALKHRIDELYTAHPYFGSRRITAVLRLEMLINRKRVQRQMREMGLQAIYPGPNLSRRHREHAIYPYLLRNVRVTHSNHVWGIDGRPYGRLMNASRDATHHQGWVSSPWRFRTPSRSGLVSFQGT